MALAVGLDLGTTAVKAARLGVDGRLEGVVSRPTPALRGVDPVREQDPLAYLSVAAEALAAASEGVAKGTPLGIASQRSSFVLWERSGGRPVTPLVSWLDRRAAAWCERHAEFEEEIVRRTGLRLSPHYAGPKLASLLESDPGLAQAMRDRRVVFGNLDSFVAQSWSEAEAHATDLTLAARTLLVDLDAADWHAALLDRFGIPREALPEILPTRASRCALPGGLRIAAIVADQAAAALAALGDARGVVLVNLGTGGFVLRACGTAPRRRDRYLTAPILGAAGGASLWVLEGTINAVAGAVDRHGRGPTPFDATDPAPEAFCLPDAAGVGSPHWRADRSLVFSKRALRLGTSDRRRVVLEGLVFRIREILDDLASEAAPERVLVSGGLAREPALAPALAACLGRPVEIREEPEATLLGAARLAAGFDDAAPAAAREVPPGEAGAYLPEKYERWRGWLPRALGPEGSGALDPR